MEQQLAELKPYDNKIQTEILDPSMPSELIEDHKQRPQLQLKLDHPQHSKSPPRPVLIDQSIDSYTVRGKSMFKMLPKYQKGAHIGMSLPTYQVTMEPVGAGGFKGFWESIVGYCNRELYICEGFVYNLEKQGQGYYIHDLWHLDELFKVFCDKDEEKIRLVFHKSKSITETHDFNTPKLLELLTRLKDQLKKIGREMI